MILNKTVFLQAKTTTYDSEAMPVDIWTANNTWAGSDITWDEADVSWADCEYSWDIIAAYVQIKANIQPLNQQSYLKMQSSDFKSNLMFTIYTQVFEAITEGMRIVDGSTTYSIENVNRWDNHYECICSLV